MTKAEDTYVADLAEEIAAILADRLDVRPLLTLDEAAAWLKVSRRKVNGLIGAGTLAKVMVGEQPRVEQRELGRYIAECRGEA